MTGRQMSIKRRSVDAKLTRKVFVGDLKDFLLLTVIMMRIFPITPRINVSLSRKEFRIYADMTHLPIDQEWGEQLLPGDGWRISWPKTLSIPVDQLLRVIGEQVEQLNIRQEGGAVWRDRGGIVILHYGGIGEEATGGRGGHKED